MKCKIIAAAIALGALALVRCLPPYPNPEPDPCRNPDPDPGRTLTRCKATADL